jgi:hypothetical protein
MSSPCTAWHVECLPETALYAVFRAVALHQTGQGRKHFPRPHVLLDRPHHGVADDLHGIAPTVVVGGFLREQAEMRHALWDFEKSSTMSLPPVDNRAYRKQNTEKRLGRKIFSWPQDGQGSDCSF